MKFSSWILLHGSLEILYVNQPESGTLQNLEVLGETACLLSFLIYDFKRI